jgi:hypothetical protein
LKPGLFNYIHAHQREQLDFVEKAFFFFFSAAAAAAAEEEIKC